MAHTGHTQKNGAVSKESTIDTAPFFCVCPVYAALFILGNQSITFHISPNCNKVFVIYNVFSVLTLLMTLCAQEPATSKWGKLTKRKFNMTIKQVAGWRNQ
jgi:hypothetical protein